MLIMEGSKGALGARHLHAKVAAKAKVQETVDKWTKAEQCLSLVACSSFSVGWRPSAKFRNTCLRFRPAVSVSHAASLRTTPLSNRP